ncbi:MAG: Stp1/IreP family PP2C-type Ser/Thr phosphatase [Gammaproteobacteria bacterium]|nr:Stp1/IreP family PP2C-type Ser/Thr phosphatase [Gammaproteobacteria bacterium]
MRENNEDFIEHDAALGVFVLADGMGGLNAGEVASAEAVGAVMRYVRAEAATLSGDAANVLQGAIVGANRFVHELAGQRKDYAGMGTTIVAAAVTETELVTAHVGDSRAYLYRDGNLARVTTDHSLVQRLVATGVLSAEQARRAPNRNIVTRALGVAGDIVCDINRVALEAGDMVMLCSDGLTDMLDDTALAAVCAQHSTLEARVEAWLHGALKAGGLDNISVIVVAR